MKRGIFLALLLTLAPAALAQPTGACNAELQQPRPVLAHVLAALAQHEHAQMGGALIAADGGLVRAGMAEAERTRRPGAELSAWQRVWRYWRAVPDFYARHLAGLDAPAYEALQRTALIDQPWSAAFISWLMREAGVPAARFVYSAAHHDYVRAAMAASEAERHGQSTGYGWRACDPAQTPPRLGDLLCFARSGDVGLDHFQALRKAVARGPVPMHCELVVTDDSRRVQLMGGNVLDTVVLRTLERQQDGSGRLWPAYLQAAHRQQWQALVDQPPAGQAQPPWPETHLSQQPWAMLLQMRATAWRAPSR